MDVVIANPLIKARPLVIATLEQAWLPGVLELYE